jgi:antirestriction protein ArdC
MVDEYSILMYSNSTQQQQLKQRSDKMSKQQQLKQELKEVQKQIVEFVIEQLEKNNKWSKCWGGGKLPYSASSGKRYKGGNCVWLSVMQYAQGYKSSQWGTYRSWKAKGGSVKKGERSTKIIFYKPIKKEDKETGETKVFFLLKSYAVFNQDQVEITNEQAEEFVHECNGELNTYFESEDIKLIEGGVPCYIPKKDIVMLPKSYNNLNEGWSTVAHEIIHSTGHAKRLNREGITKGNFDKHEYAYEELIAEIGSMFLCNDYNLIDDNSKIQSAAYIKFWTKTLRANPELIWKASSEAQKASDFVINSIASYQKNTIKVA